MSRRGTYFEKIGENLFLCHATSGTRVLIDSDVRVKLEEYINTHGALTWDGCVMRQTCGLRMSLIYILAGLYYDLDPQMILQNFNVHPVNGNHLNYTRDNISFKDRLTDPDCELMYDSIHNAVYNRGMYVLLLIKRCGAVVTFDGRNSIRGVLIDLIKAGFVIDVDEKNRHVVVRSSRGEEIKLASYVLATLTGAQWLLTKNPPVSYWDNNHLNLRLENIDCKEAPLHRTKNRTLCTQGDIVYLWRSSGLPQFTDAADTMSAILSLPLWSWGCKADGRFVARLTDEGRRIGIPFEPTIYQLRWAVEFYGASADLNKLVVALNEMAADFAEKKLEIHHLDDCYRNNCAWNLVALPTGLHAKIHGLTSKIRAPRFLTTVRLEDGFRVLAGDDVTNPRWVHCANIEAYINLLSHFYEEGLGSLCPLKDVTWGRADIQDCAKIGYDPLGHTSNAGDRLVQELLERPIEKFERWNLSGQML